MKRCLLVVLLFLGVLPATAQEEGPTLNVYYGEIPSGENTFYVAPDGDDAAAGTEEEPFATLDHAVTQVDRGDVIVMRGGIYEHDDIVRIQSPSGYIDELITVVAYPGEVPILDFSSQPKERNYHGIRLNANWWHLIGITIRNASHNGIRMDGSYNILEQLTAYGNHDSGIHMAGGASHNLIKNSDSFHNFNYDTNRTPRIGNNADGFSAKFDIGPGNRYVGCRSWENSDDGWDFWEAESTIVIDSSWSFGNGDASVFDVDPNVFEGNGNGFKLGGNYVVAEHVVRRSMAFDNFGSSGNAKGFDYNNNPGAMTLIHNTAYNNGRNYYFPLIPPEGQAVFLNNLSASTSQHAQLPPTAVIAGNSWQGETEVTDAMFVSVDTEAAKSPREMDGSLPDIDLLKPVAESFPVDAGVAIGETFYGSAPDMGAMEIAAGEPVEPFVFVGSGRIAQDLRVFDLENGDAWRLQDELNVGEDVNGGSDLTLTAVPAGLNVDDWILPAAATGPKNYLFTTAEFTATQDVHLLVAHPDDVTEKPEWLDAFTETAAALTVTGDEAHQLTIYQRPIEAGEVVTLGRNSTDGDPDVPTYVAMIGAPVNVSSEDPIQPIVETTLEEIYPNPVRSTATISFRLAAASDVSVTIFDALGRVVEEVASGSYNPGSHQLVWNAAALPSGVYYCRVVTGSSSQVQRFVRVR